MAETYTQAEINGEIMPIRAGEMKVLIEEGGKNEFGTSFYSESKDWKGK